MSDPTRSNHGCNIDVLQGYDARNVSVIAVVVHHCGGVANGAFMCRLDIVAGPEAQHDGRPTG
jgi:hypothetical protein